MAHDTAYWLCVIFLKFLQQHPGVLCKPITTVDPLWSGNGIWLHISESTSPQGWGLLSQFPPFRYFPYFSGSRKHMLAFEYHVYIWQVSPQLSCDDTCKIWMWFKESNRYFCKIENFAYGEINERSFSNPHPWSHLTVHDGRSSIIHCCSYLALYSLSGRTSYR